MRRRPVPRFGWCSVCSALAAYPPDEGGLSPQTADWLVVMIAPYRPRQLVLGLFICRPGPEILEASDQAGVSMEHPACDSSHSVGNFERNTRAMTGSVLLLLVRHCF